MDNESPEQITLNMIKGNDKRVESLRAMPATAFKKGQAEKDKQIKATIRVGNKLRAVAKKAGWSESDDKVDDSTPG